MNTQARIESVTDRARNLDILARVLAYVFDDKEARKGFRRSIGCYTAMERHTGIRDVVLFVEIVDEAIEELQGEGDSDALYHAARCYFCRNCTIGHLTSLLNIDTEEVRALLVRAKEAILAAFE